MSEVSGYLVDSDVLITAKNRYYAFAICPGFWDSLLHAHAQGQVYSIDRVRQELVSGRDDDDLVRWVEDAVPAEFFLASDGSEIVEAFTDVMRWVTRHGKYQDEAKAKFASGADGWLVAHGVATGRIVVTNEQPRPDSRTAIKLPDVCDAFSVQYEDTFPCCTRSVFNIISRRPRKRRQRTRAPKIEDSRAFRRWVVRLCRDPFLRKLGDEGASGVNSP